MKLSHSNLSTFLADSSSLVNDSQNHSSAGKSTARLSKSDIKFIDKQISKYIKNDEHISADEFQQLRLLRDVISDQQSHCTDKKLQSFDKALKKCERIKSPACIACEKIGKNMKTIADANIKLEKLEKSHQASINTLNATVKATRMPNASAGIAELKERCLRTPSAAQKHAILNDIVGSLRAYQKKTVEGQETRWGRKTEAHDRNVSVHRPGFNAWYHCMTEASKLMPTEKNINDLKAQIKTASEQNNKYSISFGVTNDHAGLDKLKTMK